jgi:hypothetical protein
LKEEYQKSPKEIELLDLKKEKDKLRNEWYSYEDDDPRSKVAYNKMCKVADKIKELEK